MTYLIEFVGYRVALWCALFCVGKNMDEWSKAYMIFIYKLSDPYMFIRGSSYINERSLYIYGVILEK